MNNIQEETRTTSLLFQHLSQSQPRHRELSKFHMHIFNMFNVQALSVATLLLSRGWALPTLYNTTENKASTSVLFTASPGNAVDHCFESTFENKTSGASPKVQHCLKLVSNISGGGDWTINTYKHSQIAQYGTCAFGVESPKGDGWYMVGSQDIIDLINDSMNKYQSEGLVGAKGQMPCERKGDGHEIDVVWGIFHTGCHNWDDPDKCHQYSMKRLKNRMSRILRLCVTDGMTCFISFLATPKLVLIEYWKAVWRAATFGTDEGFVDSSQRRAEQRRC